VAPALPEKVLMLEDPGTKALAEVDTVAAIAKRAIVFFIVNNIFLVFVYVLVMFAEV
jgi:hypothetical protein